MLPDILDLPWWVKLIIVLASAFIVFISIVIFVRNKEEKLKKKKRLEKEIEQAKLNVNFARTKLEKLLSDHPSYYFYSGQWDKIEKIKEQILSCDATSSYAYYDLAKRYADVYFNSFKPLAKYDIELKRLLNSYTDAVEELVNNKNASKDVKQPAVLMIVPYLNALDILMPRSFNRYMPIYSSIGIE